ncbi:hypothetical protein OPV22_009560 [Ensete ventricosum]|uniref:Uncharacterized protein n=1 Tax=Ensete ventricosum TaxID=4639 RepID=A0AAV8RG70_ENSVE|nr:hypothetical protein OPV22_009560 [Ensete ventricosum]
MEKLATRRPPHPPYTTVSEISGNSRTVPSSPSLPPSTFSDAMVMKSDGLSPTHILWWLLKSPHDLPCAGSRACHDQVKRRDLVVYNGAISGEDDEGGARR